MQIRGILFDKDGTLFDFGGTWNAWAAGVIQTLSRAGAGDAAARAAALADAIDYDLDAGRFRPTSPVIAGTNREAAERLQSVHRDMSLPEMEHFLASAAATAPLVPATPLAPLLDTLQARGLTLGVMTNDAERSALRQLEAAGVRDRFSFVAGYDSGHGAKPAPDPLLAFARARGLAPETVVMVGDSSHDLVAGRAAGMRTVAVLTGMAPTEALAPLADVVLPDIGHLPGWLDALAA